MSDWQCEAINRRNQLPGNTRNQLALFYCPRSIPSSPQSYLHIGRLQSRFAIWSRKRCLICQMSNQIHSSATVGWSSVDIKKSGKWLREEGKSQSEGICLSGAPLCLLTGKNLVFPQKCLKANVALHVGDIKGRHKKNRHFLGKSPKLLVGGGQES